MFWSILFPMAERMSGFVQKSTQLRLLLATSRCPNQNNFVESIHKTIKKEGPQQLMFDIRSTIVLCGSWVSITTIKKASFRSLRTSFRAMDRWSPICERLSYFPVLAFSWWRIAGETYQRFGKSSWSVFEECLTECCSKTKSDSPKTKPIRHQRKSAETMEKELLVYMRSITVWWKQWFWRSIWFGAK